MRQSVSISWSGGKDSAFALYKILSANQFDVVHLHTVIDEQSRRVGLHGVLETLIEKQADAIDVPLKKIYLPTSHDDNAYKLCIQKFYHECATEGIEGIVFGDIFLQDLRDYRLNLLKPHNLFGSFPLWGLDSKKILEEFIKTGFKTTICSADANLFSENQLGKILDRNFINSLSSDVDPCGENGEFHTFVCDGPLFKKPIILTRGEVVRRTYSYQKKDSAGKIEKFESTFWFQDFSL